MRISWIFFCLFLVLGTSITARSELMKYSYFAITFGLDSSNRLQITDMWVIPPTENELREPTSDTSSYRIFTYSSTEMDGIIYNISDTKYFDISEKGMVERTVILSWYNLDQTIEVYTDNELVLSTTPKAYLCKSYLPCYENVFYREGINPYLATGVVLVTLILLFFKKYQIKIGVERRTDKNG